VFVHFPLLFFFQVFEKVFLNSNSTQQGLNVEGMLRVIDFVHE